MRRFDVIVWGEWISHSWVLWVGNKNCQQCARNCSKSINEKSRKLICKEFCLLGNQMIQNQYLLNHIQQKNVARARVPNTATGGCVRDHTNLLVDERRCKCVRDFSTGHLAYRIRESSPYLRTSFTMEQWILKSVAITPQILNRSRWTVTSFGSTSVHFNQCLRITTAGTSFTYLSGDLNVQKMYDAYQVFCQDKKVAPAKMY